MKDLYTNEFWLKNRKSLQEHLANQSGLSLEEAKAQAICLKEWCKKEIERRNKRNKPD